MRKLKTHELQRLDPQEIPIVTKLPLVLVLDNVRSMYNVGAAFRIADAFLVEKIYLCGITAQPPHRDIHKTALGAEETVAWEYAAETAMLLKQLQAAGYLVAAVEQTDQSIPLQKYQPMPNQQYCLVFGHEVWGMSEAALSACNLSLEIPQYGTKHSLNVAVSIGIVVWELAKQLASHPA